MPENLTRHANVSTTEPDHVTPECEPQRVPADLDPVAFLEAQIRARDARIAKLLAIIEGDVDALTSVAETLDELRTEVQSARARIAELEKVLCS